MTTVSATYSIVVGATQFSRSRD